MKRKRLKKVVLIVLVLISFLLIFFSPFLIINIKLIGNKEMNLDYGEKYSEPGYKASIFNKDITDRIKVKSNVKDSIGKYEVTYSYKVLFYIVKRVRKVVVSDLTGPEITLKGEKEVSVTINTKYDEAGFEAIDKLDGDLTDKVKVTNNIDITKLGEYEVKYEVKDKAGNKSTLLRRVTVERLKPTQMSIAEFKLDGWYDDVKLKQTKNYGDEYFNKIVMVGDSNTMHMYQDGYLNANNAWAVPCLHAESMHNTNINIYGTGEEMKLIDAVSKYKPNIMILNFGTFSTEWISETTFISKANLMIEQIKEKSPNTKIILISLFPIRKGENINNFRQNIINRFNFRILEMADKYDLKYLDAEEALKDSDGYGKDEYFKDDKFHLTGNGYRVLKEYIKTHALEES